MRITLEALQILDAIDTRGSFAAAAESLHRVPSALTHAIRKLEDDLAVTLYVREGRRAVLLLRFVDGGDALLAECLDEFGGGALDGFDDAMLHQSASVVTCG